MDEKLALAAKQEADLLAILEGNGELPSLPLPQKRQDTATVIDPDMSSTVDSDRILDVPHENSLHASLQSHQLTSEESDNNQPSHEPIIGRVHDDNEDENNFGNRNPSHTNGVDTYFSNERIHIPGGEDVSRILFFKSIFNKIFNLFFRVLQ